MLSGNVGWRPDAGRNIMICKTHGAIGRLDDFDRREGDGLLLHRVPGRGRQALSGKIADVFRGGSMR